MAEQAKAAHRAFQIAKAKALKVQKVLNKHQAGASKYQTPNEDDRGAKGEPPVHDTGLIAQEEVIKEKAATVARDVHLFDAFTLKIQCLDAISDITTVVVVAAIIAKRFSDVLCPCVCRVNATWRKRECNGPH
ncbi:uncharacterized protein PHALS_05413 [Plasmopara halstedii]|uniref:Uncharacterized protein n=1 Tax=Plasmopara halstedii TaxID=4781 RepID=A0A0N7L443_PLAHL|nr:uncharacterized protein PHALS_05413 [Plasmopara halstedii]CEG37635.1 hypothetical protein PHALS_05413 [Plasmopara halstedii]|eukprot:XP_024574004.1 hypothetical protein PHALS_05413 [Plasmopara halstedii]